MEEILAAILANEAFRSFVEGVAVKVIGEILHRRATDPDFLAQSDAAFSALAGAKTQEAMQSAQNTIRLLISNG